jgi:hypothetical protein
MQDRSDTCRARCADMVLISTSSQYELLIATRMLETYGIEMVVVKRRISVRVLAGDKRRLAG